MAKKNRKVKIGSDRYEDSYKEKDKGGSGGKKWLEFSGKVKYFEPKEGVNKINIIPYEIKTKNHPRVKAGKAKIGDYDYNLDVFVHRYVGPGNADVLCPKRTYGKTCPICEEASKHYDNGQEKEGKALLASRRVKGRCVERRNTPGAVPDGTFVLAGYGGGVETLAGVNVGDSVVIRQTINAGDPDWNKCDSIIQAGPFILRNGEIQRDSENLSVGITERRHPRTVIGLTDKGRWMLWVGDGRNPIHSIGFTLDEAARLLRDYGVVYALNLDGGGSSQMIYRNRIVNLPSEGKERPVSYGIGIRSRLSK